MKTLGDGENGIACLPIFSVFLSADLSFLIAAGDSDKCRRGVEESFVSEASISPNPNERSCSTASRDGLERPASQRRRVMGLTPTVTARLSIVSPRNFRNDFILSENAIVSKDMLALLL